MVASPLRIPVPGAFTPVSFLTILSNGNTGLGVTAPTHRLDVAGDVNITGAFRVNGTPVGITTVRYPANVVGQLCQNLTGKPLFVNVCLASGSALYTCNAYCDVSSTPAKLVATTTMTGVAGQMPSISFWVLPGYYYQLISGSNVPSINSWTEWY